MNINIVERNLASCGGRQQTMISGFADCFASMGHNVKIYSNFLQGHIPKKANLLDYHLARHLTMDNFDFSHPIDRNYPDQMPLTEWSRGDMLLVPYLPFSFLGEYISCPIVSWAIAEPGKYYPQHLARIWTNSHTQKKLLGLDKARVIYAPHDYSPFRDQAMPWSERKIDVLVTTKYRHSWFGGTAEGSKVLSGEIAEAEELHNMGLKVVGLFLVKERKDIMDLMENVSFEHYINIPRTYVAGFMASSKILFHPSVADSCSLMLYEGLNAGCVPVTRETGACREQMGDVGLVYTDFDPAKKHILHTLDAGDQTLCTDSIEQGMKFDRKTNIHVIKEELEIIEALK